MNWSSTRLKNGANDAVIVPNSAIAKMRIQNHSAAAGMNPATDEKCKRHF
jgi:small-conductance mechanosensitive channel